MCKFLAFIFRTRKGTLKQHSIQNEFERKKMTKKFRDKIKTGKNISTEMGFEPTRAEHIGLAVQRLNHSATQSLCCGEPKFFDTTQLFYSPTFLC